ncbi:hypothetical protein J7K42_02455 [bacterium]|nr:hypothetical protein [bacterium]
MPNKKLIIGVSVIFSIGAAAILGFYFSTEEAKASPGLSCSVTSGACDGTVVFKMFSTDNSHAEMPDQTNYNYKVCCSGVAGLGNSCSGTYDTVLKLSAPTNAHVEEKTETNYSNPVCLSVSGGTVSCDYSTDCSALGADYVCLASISGDTNAHVGNCTAYPTKVCCKVISGPNPPINIKCEGAENPTSVTDQTPDLGAEYDHPNPASVALFYQVQVIKEGGSWSSPLWDSTKTSCSVSEGSRKEIVYGGTPLSFDRAKYYQRWKFWDDEGNEGEWSDGTDFWVMVGPPTVTTTEATSIGETEATLNGTVLDDGGEASEYRFEYDVDSGEPYTQNTDWSGAGDTKTTGQSFSKTVTNLNRGTLYYFRAQAKNNYGTASGGEKTFLTKPQKPLNFTATPGDTKITLSWTKGDGAQRTMIRRSTSDYPATPSDGAQVYFDTGESFIDTGLTNGVTYYYSAFSEVTADSLQQYSDKSTSSATPSIPPCVEHNIYGWAFAENIGWLSFSCKNCDSDNNGYIDSGACGGDNSSTVAGDYGVDMDTSTGIFSGYAWSENIGWITFNEEELSGCPSGSCRAEMDLLTAKLSGWARALTYGDGWDGWIRLSDTHYGVSLDSATEEFEGWAWGGDVIGWVSFNHLNCDPDNDGLTEGGANNPHYPQCPDGQSIADYKVETTLDFNFPPTATDLLVDQGDYCSYPLHPIFSWTFSDPDGDTQGAYQVQVDDNSDFSSPEIDSGKVLSSSESYAAPTPLSYRTTYWWRLKVWDEGGTPSIDWISGPSFTTPLHAYPDPDFTWTPLFPTKEEIVQFCSAQEAGVCPEDVSTCYDINGNEISCLGKEFLWTFPEGTEFATGTSSTSENPRVTFDSTGTKSVSLKITDEVGSCTRTKSVGVMLPLPRWREVAP